MGNDQDTYYDLYKEWDRWFENQSTNITEEETYLINKYKFTDTDISKYHKADTISLIELKQKYNIDIISKTLKTLHGGKSLSGDNYDKEKPGYLCTEGEEYELKVVVVYVFNDKMIFHSECVENIYI